MKRKTVNIALAANSGVSVAASYAGLSASLETPDIWWYVLAAMIAGATGISIFVFWQGAFKAAVEPEQFRFRSAGWLATFTGAAFLLGMSSWWNVSGIAEGQVQNIALYDTIAKAETSFASALKSGGQHQAVIPRLRSFESEIAALAACEAASGCVTGSAGKKGVYQTLVQLKEKVGGVLKALKSSDTTYQARLNEGRACLSEMREALGGDANLEDKSNRVSKSVDCVNGAIADITGHGPMEQAAQALKGFTSGIVLPVSIKTEKQRQAVASIMGGLEKSAAKIAADITAITTPVTIPPVSLVRLSPMKAVVVHYDSLLPQWITGIALDLLPLVLLWFQATMAASRRFKPHSKAYDLSVGELIDAMEIADEIRDVRRARKVMTIDLTAEKMEPGE